MAIATGTALLLGAGLSAGASVVGARTQQSAARDAARTEDAASREALAYQKEQDAYERKRDEEQTNYDRGQYADYLGRLDPYRAAGTGALARLSSHLGGSAPAMSYPVDQVGMVKLQSPDGRVREVPADQAEHYLAQGATRVS